MNIHLTNIYRPTEIESLRIAKMDNGSYDVLARFGAHMCSVHTDRASLERLRDSLNTILAESEDQEKP